jgi:hypothetical protein
MFPTINEVIDFLNQDHPINPLTKRRVKKGGKIYLQIEKQIHLDYPELFIEQPEVYEIPPQNKPKEIVRKLYAFSPEQRNEGIPKRYRKMILQSPVVRIKDDLYYFPKEEPLQKYIFKKLKQTIDKSKFQSKLNWVLEKDLSSLVWCGTLLLDDKDEMWIKYPRFIQVDSYSLSSKFDKKTNEVLQWIDLPMEELQEVHPDIPKIFLVRIQDQKYLVDIEKLLNGS